MDYLEVNQPGGFPMTTNILNHLQNAASIFQAFGELAGDYTIISGCEEVGNTVENGVVYFKGELFPFKGGLKTTKIRIIETNETKNFQDGSTKAVVFKRYVEFGSSIEDYVWEDFKRIDPLVTLTQKVSKLEKTAAVFIQGGGMVLWNKPAADIPEGWQEVVNWRGRMPVGFDSTQPEFNSMGKTGGAKTHTLTIDEMPNHGHDWKHNTERDDDDHGGSYREFTQAPGNIPTADSANPIGKTGGGNSHNNLSPYRVVMFIERI